MSKTTDLLGTVGVYNDFQFFDDGADRVWLSYRPTVHNEVGVSRWTVSRLRNGHRLQTDPRAPWSDHGHKTFPGHARHEGETWRAAGLREAQEWCAEKFGIFKWKRTPFGGYGEAEFVDRRLAELRAKAEGVPS